VGTRASIQEGIKMTILSRDLIEPGTMRVLAEAGQEYDNIKVCPECGEEFEPVDDEDFCEVCMAYGNIESMDYGG
jgi:predicted amidophosphoribosyltransferase